MRRRVSGKVIPTDEHPKTCRNSEKRIKFIKTRDGTTYKRYQNKPVICSQAASLLKTVIYSTGDEQGRDAAFYPANSQNNKPSVYILTGQIPVRGHCAICKRQQDKSRKAAKGDQIKYILLRTSPINTSSCSTTDLESTQVSWNKLTMHAEYVTEISEYCHVPGTWKN